MSDTAALPCLYHFRISHFNEKVRWALDWKRIPHRRVSLVPGFHIPTTWWVSGQTGVPILDLTGEGTALFDSTAILHELERRWPDPPLFPSDPAQRERALALEAWFDDEVADDLRRVFWSTIIDDAGFVERISAGGAAPLTQRLYRTLFPLMRPLFKKDLELDAASIERSRARVAGHFDRLEAEIGPAGFLVGDAFSVADLAAASITSALVRPPQFAHPLPEPLPAPLVELRATLSERKGWKWVLETYAKHRSPSAEVIP